MHMFKYQTGLMNQWSVEYVSPLLSQQSLRYIFTERTLHDYDQKLWLIVELQGLIKHTVQ